MDTPDGITLYQLYVVEQKSLAEIGRLYGVHKTQVRRWLLRASISTRSVGEGTKLGMEGWMPSEEHRRKMVENAANARTGITEESRRKQAAKMRGREAHNKGKTWTPEERAKHMAIRATPEYREKLAAAQRGDLARTWQGGKSPDSSLRGWKWRRRRAEAYARDNWTCRDCGRKCGKDQGVRIQAHHIVSRRDGGSDDLENLVTLCVGCHRRKHREE